MLENVRVGLYLVAAILGSFCKAECLPSSFEPENVWKISAGISAIQGGGINTLPIVSREHSLDNEGWEGKLRTAELGWAPAWEVEVEKNLCGGGRVGIQYWGTHFNNSFTVQNEGPVLQLLFSGAENDGTDLDLVTTNVKLNAAKIALKYMDLIVSNCNSNSQFNYYAGLTYFYLDSTVLAEGFQGGGLEHFTKNKDINHLIGPTAGLQVSYFWSNCTNLYVDASFTAAYNSHKIHRIEGPENEVDSPMNFHYRYDIVTPVVESAIGLTFSKLGWEITAEYGFKWFYRLFDSVQQIDDLNVAAGCSTPHDVTFHGPTLRIRRNF